MNLKITSRSISVMLTPAVWLAASLSAYAFYNPSIGRWLSRDPIGERGGVNSYAFVGNNPASSVDILGRTKGPGKYANCACVGWKKIPVSLVILYGSDGIWISDLTRTREVYEQACVVPQTAGFAILGRGMTELFIGDDLILQVPPPESTWPSSEEIDMANYRLNSFTHAYFVKGTTMRGLRGTAYAYSRPGYQYLAPAIVVINARAVDTFAHELGHVLLDDGSHLSDPNNLMAAGVIRNFKDELTEAQCDRIRASRLLKD